MPWVNGGANSGRPERPRERALRVGL